jgi:hypothetical protein
MVDFIGDKLDAALGAEVMQAFHFAIAQDHCSATSRRRFA